MPMIELWSLMILQTRYRSLFRMTWQYRHLQVLKHCGRGHEVGGIKVTGPGALAIRCIACPWPGVNLVEGWKDRPKCEK